MYRTLAAICSAVVVLPHHLGPSIRTAPFPSSFLARISSAILFLYSFISITSNFNPFIYSIHNFRENTIPFGRLAEYHSGDWRNIIREIGGKQFGRLAKYYSESWLKAQQYIVAVKKIKNFKFYPHFLPPPWPIGERTYETGPKRNLKTEYTRARYFCYAAEHVQSTRHDLLCRERVTVWL